MELDDCIRKYESWKVAIMPLFPRTKQPCLNSWSHLILERAKLDVIWKWKETYWNPSFWQAVWNGEKEPKLKERWIKALREDWKKAGVEDQLDGWSYDSTLGIAVIGSPKASDGLVLVDIEDISLLSEADQAAIKGDAWKTAVVKTGKPNGHHVYLKFPTGAAENCKKPNGEIRAFGQYVAAPPTVHPNGVQYTFIKDFAVHRIDQEQAKEAIDHLVKLISAKEDKILSFARKIPIEAGKRSDWIVALTAYYKAQKLGEKETYDVLLTIPICADKLSENGFDWWKQYEWDFLEGSLDNGISGLMYAASEQSCIPLSPDIKKEIKAVDSEIQGGISLEDVCIPIIDEESGKTKDYKFSPSKAAGAILNKFSIMTTEDETEWIYRDGVFVPRGVISVDKILDRICGDKYNINSSREVHKKIKVRTTCETWPFDPDPFKFGADNVIVNLRDGSIESYKPDNLITLRSPVIYDPNAVCPIILKFLQDSLGDEDSIKTVIDIFVAMACAIAFEYFVCLVGVGSNGKKMLETLIEKFFGSDQLTATRIDELGSNPFIRGDLLGKRVLINSEVTGDKKESNWIKAISSGDTIDSDRKNKTRIKFNPFCLIILDTNNPPKFHDASNGFTRRFIKLDFPYIFTDSPDVNNPREKPRDADLSKKITSPSEMSGLLNLIIKRAPEIIGKREIFRGKTGIQMLAEYDRQTYTVSTFISEFCETTLKNTFISSEELYNQYKLYCTGINASPKHENPFFKSISKLPTAKRVPQSIETGGKRGYSGVIIKKEALDIFLQNISSYSSSKSGESGEIRSKSGKPITASPNQQNGKTLAESTEKILQKYTDKKGKNGDSGDFAEADSGIFLNHQSPQENCADLKMSKIERETPVSDATRIKIAARLEYGMNGQCDARIVASKLSMPVEVVTSWLDVNYEKKGEYVYTQKRI